MSNQSNPTGDKNLFAALYDFKLIHVVTLKFMRIIYAGSVIVITAATLIAVILGISNGSAGLAFIFLLIYFPILLTIRIYFEIITALFQVARNTQQLVTISRQVASGQ